MRGKSKCSWRTTEHTRLIRRKFVHEFFEYVNDAKADVYACSRVEKNERGTIDAHSTTSRGMLAKGVPEPRCTTFQLIPRDFAATCHCVVARIRNTLLHIFKNSISLFSPSRDLLCWSSRSIVSKDERISFVLPIERNERTEFGAGRLAINKRSISKGTKGDEIRKVNREG